MRRTLIVAGLAAALILALLSPLASSKPDGLERVAEDHGFLELAQAPAYEALPDYAIPGVASESLSTILAGIVGTLIVFGVAYGIGGVVKRRQATDSR